jgi:hypothetical protein
MKFRPPVDRIRWLECRNASAEEAPGFALVKIAGVDADGTLQLAKPDTDGQDGLVLGPAALAAGARGLCTADFPAWALYDVADGTPALGETWGAGAGSWKLRKNKPGWRVLGGAADGRVIVLRNELTGLAVAAVDGSPSYSGIVSLQYDEADGLSGASPGAGIFRLDLLPASTTQIGVWIVGAQTLAGQKTIQNQSATDIALTLQAHASQSSDVQRWITSGGTVRARINSVCAFSDPSGGTSSERFGQDVLVTAVNNTQCVAVGNGSMRYADGASNTIGIGYQALGAATFAGSNIVAIGMQSGQNATTAAHCMFIGSETGKSVTTGQHNCAVGTQALYVCQTASYHVGIGSLALRNTGAGSSGCVAIGYSSGYTNETGSYNTLLGYQADVSTASTSNAIALGRDAIAAANEFLVSAYAYYTKLKPRTALTNTTNATLQVGHNTSGTPAAGFGLVQKFQLESSTTEDQEAADFTITWSDPTHATRTSKLEAAAYYAGNRKVGWDIEPDSDGTHARTKIYEECHGAFTEKTISTGTITKDRTTHSVDTEADAASDDLDTISGGVEGDILILKIETSSRTVTVKHGTGNILLASATDYTLSLTRHRLGLQFDGTNWVELFRQQLDTTVRFSGCRVYKTSSQSIDSGTLTAINFDAERYDTDTYHDTVTNNTRLTIALVGYYHIGGCVEFEANAVGIRALHLRVNGTTYIASQQVETVTTGRVTVLSVSTDYCLTATDYVELVVEQDSGGALGVTATANTSPEFWLHHLPGFAI